MDDSERASLWDRGEAAAGDDGGGGGAPDGGDDTGGGVGPVAPRCRTACSPGTQRGFVGRLQHSSVPASALRWLGSVGVHSAEADWMWRDSA